MERNGQYDTGSTTLMLLSGSGFGDALRQKAADRCDVLLIGLDEIYGRDLVDV